MSFEFSGEASSLGPDLARINRAAQAISYELAANLRRKTMGLVYETFEALRKADLETEQLLEESDYPEGTNPPTYLMLDMLAGPNREPGEQTSAVTYLLVRDDTEGIGKADVDLVHLYLPVPNGFKLGPDTPDLPPLDPAKGIWVKLEKLLPGGDRQARRYAITKDDVTEYSALADPASELVQDRLIIRDEADKLGDYQRLSQAMLAQLLEDHRNFRVVPQPYEPIL